LEGGFVEHGSRGAVMGGKIPGTDYNKGEEGVIEKADVQVLADGSLVAKFQRTEEIHFDAASLQQSKSILQDSSKIATKYGK
jgi:hypothetical protein